MSRQQAKQPWLAIAVLAVLVPLIAACGAGETIRVDGSSTVGPLSELAGELFNRENPDVKVGVGTSGTGGGFQKFCNGETDITGASRPIKPEEEEACAASGIAYEELIVANDALTLVVQPDNPVDCMTVGQIRQVLGPDATITRWGEIEDLEVELDAELQLFTPGADSGTFDFFTEAVNEASGAQRSANVNIVGENDNATVVGVAESIGGLGYFGFSYFQENEDRLKALEIEDPETGECVAPTAETTQSHRYSPLSRQLYVYVSAAAVRRPEVVRLLEMYIERSEEITAEAGFIAMTEEQQRDSLDRVAELAERGR